MPLEDGSGDERVIVHFGLIAALVVLVEQKPVEVIFVVFALILRNINVDIDDALVGLLAGLGADLRHVPLTILVHSVRGGDDVRSRLQSVEGRVVAADDLL